MWVCLYITVSLCFPSIYSQNLSVTLKAFVETSEHTNLRVGGKDRRNEGRRKEREGHSLPCSMNLFKSISICVHIFITSVIIKSQHHRWCPHTVSFPGSHWANEAGLPVRPVSTDQVVMWRDRWALADRWQDDPENLPPFLGSGSSWQVLFHKITSKRNRQGLRINLRLQPAM